MLLIGEVGQWLPWRHIPRHTDTHSFKCLFFFFSSGEGSGALFLVSDFSKTIHFHFITHTQYYQKGAEIKNFLLTLIFVSISRGIVHCLCIFPETVNKYTSTHVCCACVYTPLFHSKNLTVHLQPK